jgi:hypothetical protein
MELRSESMDDEEVTARLEVVLVSVVIGATDPLEETGEDGDLAAIHHMNQMTMMSTITVTIVFPVFDICM